ncbi:PorV/PorQ family protein [candidate division WOR-3 bacterium]|nr:PorV/PorQ family protein [candidate division WOR-3 bacterium]
MITFKKKMLIALILFSNCLLAQEIATGLDFLKLGVGARPCAMGEAFSSIADDGSASYWNPAGLGNIEGPIIFATHTEWFIGTRYEYLSGTIPLTFGTLSLSGTYLTSGEIEGRNELGELTDTYNSSDVAIGIAYGKEILTDLLVGMQAKFIQENIDQSSGTGFGFDIGCLYKSSYGLGLGLVVQNLGTSITLIEDNTKLPMTLRAGISYSIMTSYGRITPAFDLEVANTIKENIGLEFVLLNVLALRGGYRIGLDQTYFTIGTGVSYGLGKINLQIDYAYAGLSDFGGGHKISLAFNL